MDLDVKESELSYELTMRVNYKSGEKAVRNSIISRNPLIPNHNKEKEIDHIEQSSGVDGIIVFNHSKDEILLRIVDRKEQLKITDTIIPKHKIEDVCKMLLEFKCHLWSNETKK